MNSYAVALAACLLGTTIPALAQNDAAGMQKTQSGVPVDSPIEWQMCHGDGIAVEGYDLVSYRNPDGPMRGSAIFSSDYNGLTYHFVSAENKARFERQPERFIPAYAGFCAISLALGRVTCPEVTNFKIENDQLLLFETTGFTNGRVLWNSDPANFRRQANENFGVISSRR